MTILAKSSSPAEITRSALCQSWRWAKDLATFADRQTAWLVSLLLFGRRKEINASMHWTWPLEARVGNGRDKEANYSFTSDARPDFLCVGAQKGGTSWLYQQLASHPDFWMPPIKELHYFDKLSRTKAAPPRPRDERDLCFLERIKSLRAKPHIALENYARLFEPKGAFLSGDISPTYSMLNDEIIERVVSYFPNLKVIFLARDPVDRAWSQLSMGVRLGMISPFDETDSDEVIRNLLNPGVLSLSHPSKIVARWKRYVHPDRFRIYFFDDLKRNPTELRCCILRFLGPTQTSQAVGPRGITTVGQEWRSFCLQIKCDRIWLSSLRKSSRPVRRDWAGQPEIGRRDMAFQYSFFSGSWQTISISLPGATGLPRRCAISRAQRPRLQPLPAPDSPEVQPGVFPTSGKALSTAQSKSDPISSVSILLSAARPDERCVAPDRRARGSARFG